MKKILFILLLFIPIFVYAKEDITIDSLELVDNLYDNIELVPATTEDNKIVLNLEMNQPGDGFTYQFKINNNTGNNYIFSGIESNSQYIHYDLMFNDHSSVIEAHSSKNVLLNVSYSSELPNNIFVNGLYNDTAVVNATFTEYHQNPLTSNGMFIPIIVFALLFFVIMFVFRDFYGDKYNKLKKSMLFLFGFLFVPFMVFALDDYKIKIESHIQVKKLTEFDHGVIINSKMKNLAQDSSIVGFERSSSLPDSVRDLVNEQLNALNTDITDEEVDYAFNNILNYALVFNDIVFPSDSENLFYLTDTSSNVIDYFEEELKKRLIRDYFYILRRDGYEDQYIIYDFDEEKIRLVDIDKCKEVIKYLLPLVKKTQNIFSSTFSKSLIYGWFDNHTIYYYSDDENIYLNRDSSFLFSDLSSFTNASSIENLDTSQVINMSYMFSHSSDNITSIDLSNWSNAKLKNMAGMFYKFATSTDNLSLVGLDHWDTSKVKDMSKLFSYVCYNATVCSVGDLTNWDTSNVIDMQIMFKELAYSANSFQFGDLSHWNTGKVTNMFEMFKKTAYVADSFNIGNIANWDVSNVTDMSWMFYEAGRYSNSWSIGDLSRWNTSNVSSMQRMFERCAMNSSTFDIGNIGNWNVSNVTDMSHMFNEAGRSALTWNIGQLTNWNTSSLMNIQEMFRDSAYEASTFDIGNIGNWNVSNVTDMNQFLYNTGFNALSWNIGDLSNWDTKNVVDMHEAFKAAGYSATEWSIGHLNNWNTSSVTNMFRLFAYAGYSCSDWNVGDLNNWNTKNVVDMSELFKSSGYNASYWNVGDLSRWNTSKAVNMYKMFEQAGYSSSVFDIGNLSNWNTSEVTNMEGMFSNAGRYSTTWNIGQLSSWNTLKVTNMKRMLHRAGYSSDSSVNLGTLKVYADDISEILSSSRNIEITVNLYNNPSSFDEAFDDISSSNVIVNYTDDVVSIDDIIATGSGATKGDLLET